jgi:hypothetical protein
VVRVGLLVGLGGFGGLLSRVRTDVVDGGRGAVRVDSSLAWVGGVAVAGPSPVTVACTGGRPAGALVTSSGLARSRWPAVPNTRAAAIVPITTAPPRAVSDGRDTPARRLPVTGRTARHAATTLTVRAALQIGSLAERRPQAEAAAWGPSERVAGGRHLSV